VIEQAEVELANRNGRLHPAQRGKLLDLNFWAAAVVAIAGLVVAVLIALVADTAGEVLGTVVPILALAAWFAYVCWRRLADAGCSRSPAGRTTSTPRGSPTSTRSACTTARPGSRASRRSACAPAAGPTRWSESCASGSGRTRSTPC